MRQRGVTMGMVLLVLTIMFTIGAAMVAISVLGLNTVAQGNADRQAYFAAYAGVEASLVQLENSFTFTGFPNPTTTLSGNPAGTPDGTYSVQVFNNVSPTATMTVPAPANVVLPSPAPPGTLGEIFILSSGTDASGRVTRQLGVMAQEIEAFKFGLFTKGTITMSGANATIDGFNSALGTPGEAASQIYGTPAPSTFVNQVAVATDQDAAGAISGGNVLGSVLVGPGATPTGTAVSGTNVSGSTTQLPRPISVNQVSLPSPTPADSGTLSSATTLTSGGSPYYFSGGISLNSQTVAVNASSGNPVIVYVNGPISVSGNPGSGINTAGIPPNLIIFGLSGCTSITVSGNAAIVGAIFAPGAAVTDNGGGNSGGIFGAVVSSSFQNNGHDNLHVDVSLNGLTIPGGLQEQAWYRF
ncbi:MAG: DUF7305 domain-containing protein [Candidatus Xenobia bacterium]